jgi:hypothetical protein
MSFQDKSRCFDEVQEENFILSCIKSAAAEVDLKLFRFNFTFLSKLPSKAICVECFPWKLIDKPICPDQVPGSHSNKLLSCNKRIYAAP